MYVTVEATNQKTAREEKGKRKRRKENNNGKKEKIKLTSHPLPKTPYSDLLTTIVRPLPGTQITSTRKVSDAVLLLRRKRRLRTLVAVADISGAEASNMRITTGREGNMYLCKCGKGRGSFRATNSVEPALRHWARCSRARRPRSPVAAGAGHLRQRRGEEMSSLGRRRGCSRCLRRTR